MKVGMNHYGELIIEPECGVDHYALTKWLETECTLRIQNLDRRSITGLEEKCDKRLVFRKEGGS